MLREVQRGAQRGAQVGAHRGVDIFLDIRSDHNTYAQGGWVAIFFKRQAARPPLFLSVEHQDASQLATVYGGNFYSLRLLYKYKLMTRLVICGARRFALHEFQVFTYII